MDMLTLLMFTMVAASEAAHQKQCNAVDESFSYFPVLLSHNAMRETKRRQRYADYATDVFYWKAHARSEAALCCRHFALTKSFAVFQPYRGAMALFCCTAVYTQPPLSPCPYVMYYCAILEKLSKSDLYTDAPLAVHTLAQNEVYQSVLDQCFW